MTKDFLYPEEKKAAAISRRLSQYSIPAEKIVIKITDIIKTEERRIQVTTEFGNSVWLPRKPVDFVPGGVVLPVWLYRKLSGHFLNTSNGGINHGRVSGNSPDYHTAESV